MVPCKKEINMDRRVIEASHECVVHWKITHLSFFKCPKSGDPVLTYNNLRNEIKKECLVAASTQGSLYYKNSEGVDVLITGLEQLQHALDEQGSKPLKVRIVAKCSNFAMVTIMHGDSFLRIPSASQGVLSYESLHVRVRDHFRVPSSCKFELVQADPNHPAEQQRNIASDYDVKRVAHLIWRKDGKKDNLQLATLFGCIDVVHNPCCSCFLRERNISSSFFEGRSGINKSLPIVQSAPYTVKVMHKGRFYRLTVPRGKLEFSLEELRRRIRGLLNLPPSAQFMLAYIDADQENITITGDYDLEDAIVLQSLQPLRVNVLMNEKSKQTGCRYLISWTKGRPR